MYIYIYIYIYIIHIYIVYIVLFMCAYISMNKCPFPQAFSCISTLDATLASLQTLIADSAASSGYQYKCVAAASQTTVFAGCPTGQVVSQMSQPSAEEELSKLTDLSFKVFNAAAYSGQELSWNCGRAQELYICIY